MVEKYNWLDNFVSVLFSDEEEEGYEPHCEDEDFNVGAIANLI